MPISMNPGSIFLALYSVFDSGAANSAPLNFITLCNGTPPGIIANLTDAQILSGSSTIGSGVNFPTSCWSVPSRGVCILVNGINIPIRTSLPANKIPNFVRIGNYGLEGMEVPVDTVKGTDNFVVSSLSTVVSASYVVLRDARLKIQTEGPFSLNNGLANAILSSWTGNMPSTTGYYGSLLFGLQYASFISGPPVSWPLVFEAYDGPVPQGANYEATGTKLWSVSLGNVNSSSNAFSITNNTVSLVITPTANVIANGTPTYVRISKAALSGVDVNGNPYSYPKMVIQAPVGEGSGYVTFDRTTFITGQSVSLNSFTMMFYPNMI